MRLCAVRSSHPSSQTCATRSRDVHDAARWMKPRHSRCRPRQPPLRALVRTTLPATHQFPAARGRGLPPRLVPRPAIFLTRPASLAVKNFHRSVPSNALAHLHLHRLRDAERQPGGMGRVCQARGGIPTRHCAVPRARRLDRRGPAVLPIHRRRVHQTMGPRAVRRVHPCPTSQDDLGLRRGQRPAPVRRLPPPLLPRRPEARSRPTPPSSTRPSWRTARQRCAPTSPSTPRCSRPSRPRACASGTAAEPR